MEYLKLSDGSVLTTHSESNGKINYIVHITKDGSKQPIKFTPQTKTT